MTMNIDDAAHRDFSQVPPVINLPIAPTVPVNGTLVVDPVTGDVLQDTGISIANAPQP